MLFARAIRLPGVRQAPSAISVPGAVALVLDDHHGPKDAFMVGGEFAHFHPEPDCSLHLTLPPGAASEVLSGGWGEPHYLAARGQIPGSHLMVYAPRDPVELEVVWKVLQVSYNFARGSWKPPSP